MYPACLENHQKRHWSSEEIFGNNPFDWIHAFVMKDYGIGMHTQGFYEINIVLGSKGRHYIEEQQLLVQKGDTFIIPPNVRHGYVSEPGFDVYHVLIRHKFLEKYYADLQEIPCFFTLFNIEPLMRISGSTPLHLRLNDSQYESITYLLYNLMRWTQPTDAIGAVMCNSNALMLITQLCAIYSENGVSPASKTQLQDVAFMRSIELIYERFAEKITIERLAKIAGRSRTAYIELFKRIMGISPARFILKKRLDEAKKLLKNTDISVAEIAVQTGFYDSAHFIRCFSKDAGDTPVAFRNTFGG